MNVPGFGPTTATYAIVGEAPGAEERRLGRPFVGPSGALLRESLERVGLDPDEAYITNVYKEYRYGNPTPTPAEVAAARAELTAELRALPNLDGILLLGNTPLLALTGLRGITRHRGVHESEWTDVPVFATLHPAAILRNVRYKSDWLNDLATYAALINDTTEAVDVVHIHELADLERLREAAVASDWSGALDVETTIGELFKGEVVLIAVGVSFDGRTSFVLTHETPELLAEGLKLLSQGKWIMHNGSFDLLVLEHLTPYEWTLSQDTMAMAYLLHPEERKGLEILSGVYLGLPPYKGVDYKNILDEPIEKVVEMNGRDVARTYQLFRPLADELNQNPHLSRTYQWLLRPAIPALVRLTLKGVPVDRVRLDELETALSTELEGKLISLRERAGKPDPETYGKEDWPKKVFNPGSTQQVAHLLFDVMGFKSIKDTDKGKPSTDREVLEKLSATGDHPFLVELLEYRKAYKLLTAFVQSWKKLLDENDMLHPRYKPTQVVTGRLAAESPNIQQVPRDDRFRGVFGGREGMVWIKADLSQIELRIAAWLAGETAMLQAFREGADLHALTAERILGDASARQVGKTLNFGLLYGAYPGKLREIARSQYGVSLTKQQAERYRGLFFETYPRLAEWHSEVKSELHATGRVESPLGRVRTFPEIADPDEWVVKAAEREAINHPVQSFASDLVLGALVRLPYDVRQYAMIEVHDEIGFFAPAHEVQRITPIIKATMEDVRWLEKWGIDLDVPVLAEVTESEYWK